MIPSDSKFPSLLFSSASLLSHIESIPLQSQKYSIPLTCQIMSRGVDLIILDFIYDKLRLALIRCL